MNIYREATDFKQASRSPLLSQFWLEGLVIVRRSSYWAQGAIAGCKKVLEANFGKKKEYKLWVERFKIGH